MTLKLRNFDKAVAQAPQTKGTEQHGVGFHGQKGHSPLILNAFGPQTSVGGPN